MQAVPEQWHRRLKMATGRPNPCEGIRCGPRVRGTYTVCGRWGPLRS